ncbi:MAG: MaoC family dehydratase N-terminal domain-containing protein [Gammaproteobacteria bacterium]
MSEPSWGLYGTWEEAERFVGKVIGQSVGVDAVELGSIRRWLEPKEFDCVLHTDRDAAVAAGFRDVVAPSTMVFTYGLPAQWAPGDPNEKMGDEPRQIPIPVIFDVPAPCTLSFASNIDMEFLEPMHVGDRITRTSRLKSITHKELRVGKGAFMTQEDTYTNQRDEKVAVVLLTIFRFIAPDHKEG